MIEMTGVESKIEGLIEVLREDDGRILEICRSGKMTMRRGNHVSSVLQRHGHAEGRAAEARDVDPARWSDEQRLRPVHKLCCDPQSAATRSVSNPEKERRENHGDDLLRSRRGPLADPGQEGGHHRLRLPGACARSQPEGLRRAGEGGPGGQLQVHCQGAEGRP